MEGSCAGSTCCCRGCCACRRGSLEVPALEDVVDLGRGVRDARGLPVAHRLADQDIFAVHEADLDDVRVVDRVDRRVLRDRREVGAPAEEGLARDGGRGHEPRRVGAVGHRRGREEFGAVLRVISDGIVVDRVGRRDRHVFGNGSKRAVPADEGVAGARRVAGRDRGVARDDGLAADLVSVIVDEADGIAVDDDQVMALESISDVKNIIDQYNKEE